MCQGRPNEPCPASRNDRSVRSTQGDLFLCKACENFRFPPVTVKSLSGNKDETSSGNAKTTRPSSSSNSDELPSVGLITAAEVEAIVQKAVLVAVTNIKELFNTKLAEISHRISTVESGAIMIDKRLSELEQKVEVLSACSQAVTASVPPAYLETTVGQAVRAELRRKKNVVISGLPHIDGKKDSDVLRNFCEDHLGIKPWFDEGKCRRIGKASPKRLLISLNSEQAAADLITVAKQCLSQLDKNIAESKVYFNRDLSGCLHKRPKENI